MPIHELGESEDLETHRQPIVLKMRPLSVVHSLIGNYCNVEYSYSMRRDVMIFFFILCLFSGLKGKPIIYICQTKLPSHSRGSMKIYWESQSQDLLLECTCHGTCPRSYFFYPIDLNNVRASGEHYFLAPLLVLQWAFTGDDTP